MTGRSTRDEGAIRGIRVRAAVPDGRAVWFGATCMARCNPTGAGTGIHGLLRKVPEEGPAAGEKKTGEP